MWYNMGMGVPILCGALAQLIERGIRIAEVRSLTLLRSTRVENEQKSQTCFEIFWLIHIVYMINIFLLGLLSLDVFQSNNHEV